MSAKETSESQRRAYQRDGRLGRAYFPDAMGPKPKPKYKPASPPRYPDAPGGNNNSNKNPNDYNKSAKQRYNEMTKTPRSGNVNPDKSYGKTGYKSSNPAKNRAYPGTVGQMGKALEKAYERGRADGARMVGAKTTSIKGRIPLVRQVRQNRISPLNGRPITPTGGGSRVRVDGVGRGGGIRIGTRRGIGER